MCGRFLALRSAMEAGVNIWPWSRRAVSRYLGVESRVSADPDEDDACGKIREKGHYSDGIEYRAYRGIAPQLAQRLGLLIPFERLKPAAGAGSGWIYSARV
jgi:hypothetical protein